MKIVLLSSASIIHTARWANGLSAAGHEVHVISQHPELESFNTKVHVHILRYRGIMGYFTMTSKIRRLLKKIQPDILNAHYASGYGTTARLVNFHPWVLSVWGSDVYDFPYKSSLHRWLVQKNILSADTVASTSYCMAEQIRNIVPKLEVIPITPFGVDMSNYTHIEPVSLNNTKLTIGTVKTMADKYGIDTLIQAFALLQKKLNDTNPKLAQKIRLRLVGGGSQINQLKQLAENLGIASSVDFTGRVPHQEVPNELAKLDIYVALSRLDSESFGVAIIEAGAAGRPVVVSDAGGLPEVTLDGITGLVVPRDNPQAAANVLEKLVNDSHLRQKMGLSAKQHVEKNYSWPNCISTMLDVYQRTINNYEKLN